MPLNSYFLILVTYVFAYYFTARNTLIALKRADPGYFNDPPGSDQPVGMTTSMDIWRILFDPGLPKESYPRSIKSGLLVARTMLGLFLPFAIGLAFLVRL
jgi:hypothetical protein